MADVFVSYSREDKPRAEAIATALGNAGYEVFWDNEIPPGSTWADYLQAKITGSKALVVLWTATSTQSQWVREEARIGRDSKKLVPIILDGAAPPFGFGEVQAVDLTGWRGEPDNPEWKRFLNGLAFVVQQGGGGTPQPRGPQRPVNMMGGPAPAGIGAVKSFPKPLLYAGIGLVALLGIGSLVSGGSGPGAGPPAVGGGGVLTPSSPVALSATVQAAVDKAQAAQRDARIAVAEARTNAPLGQQAAQLASTGQQGYGMNQGAAGAIAGDLIGLQSGRSAPVMLETPMGQISGLMQATSQQDFTIVGSAVMPGGLTGEGRWVYSGERYSFLGAGSVAGKYSFEGTQAGAQAEGAGIAVIRYANGDRYEGEYRVVGEGAQAQIFRHGLGAHYGANGSILNTGRFDNDRYAGPS